MRITTVARVLSGIAVLASACAASGADGHDFESGSGLLAPGLLFEKNATDAEAEIILVIDSEVAFARLVLEDPRGAEVLRVSSDDGESLGLTELILESAEPDLLTVMAAYPEGEYRVLARLARSGKWVSIEVDLSYELPTLPVVVSPAADRRVSAQGAVISWRPDPDVAAWIVEIEQEGLDLELEVRLPGTSTSFSIPDGFLVQGEEFELGVLAQSSSGNVVAVESSFSVE